MSDFSETLIHSRSDWRNGAFLFTFGFGLCALIVWVLARGGFEGEDDFTILSLYLSPPILLIFGVLGFAVLIGRGPRVRASRNGVSWNYHFGLRSRHWNWTEIGPLSAPPQRIGLFKQRTLCALSAEDHRERLKEGRDERATFHDKFAFMPLAGTREGRSDAAAEAFAARLNKLREAAVGDETAFLGTSQSASHDSRPSPRDKFLTALWLIVTLVFLAVLLPGVFR
ncbi:MAG: hypothetical protein AAFU55_05235 [Pseudomonadota bacterium]